MSTTQHGRGRQTFYFLKPLLVLGCYVLRMLPRGLSVFGLVLLRHMPTRIGIGIRYVFAKRLAKRCGDNVALFDGTYVLHWENIEFGDHVSIHPMCYLDGAGGLKIGSNVSIAHGTSILTFEHEYQDTKLLIRDAPSIMRPVTIGDDVWIGAGVRILGGCSIGSHVVIGAGAVVTKDIPASTLAVGVPAQVIRRLHRMDLDDGSNPTI